MYISRELTYEIINIVDESFLKLYIFQVNGMWNFLGELAYERKRIVYEIVYISRE